MLETSIDGPDGFQIRHATRVSEIGRDLADLAAQLTAQHHYPDGVSASKDLHYGVTIEGPDYAELGSHFGFHGERVEKRTDLNGALKGPMPVIENKGNIELVAKYYDKLAEALSDE